MVDAAASLYAAGKGRVLRAEDNGHLAKPGTPQGKARASAQDFEAVFLQTMIGEMLSGLGKDGPLGEGEAGGAWRGMLVQEYFGNHSQGRRGRRRRQRLPRHSRAPGKVTALNRPSPTSKVMP